MALATLTVASFEDGRVVITCEADDASLAVSSVSWSNQTAAPYDLAWGDTLIAVPAGEGTKHLPKNRYVLVPEPDDGLAWGFQVRCGRGR